MGGIMGDGNLRALWERLAANRGEHVFMTFEDRRGSVRSYTYAEFDRLINRTANCLLSLGVEAGQNVAVQLYNCPEHVSVAVALAKIGAVAVPINMQHKLEECAYVLKKCGIDAVVCEPDCQYYYLEEAAGPRRETYGTLGEGERPYSLSRVLVSHAKGQELYGEAIDFDAAVAACSDELVERRPLDELDTCMIIFTSGTTSCPKGVELTHGNFLFGGAYGAWQCGLGPDDRLLTTMPAFHSNFQTAALMPVLCAGATLVFVEKYSARRYWGQVRKHGATAVQLVAMMVRTMMMQPCDPAERDHCVRSAQYYLAISDEEHDAFEGRFGVRLQNCYGSTESVCWVLTDRPCGERRWPSVGRPGPGYEVEIREGGRALPVGEVGEIAVRGERGIALMKGYYADAEATARAVDEGGWYLTGDKGYRDADGWFYFVDRKSNMIKRAGENISASEVEDVLAEHPFVSEAAVIGVPDPVRDQAVKAFVVLERGTKATVEELVGHCARHLADYKVPTIVEIVEDLPRTSVGKVAKKLLV
ncbi:crotonobetaine/carnitine-CoA ligase [Gordonibacter sp. An230]|nr:crotonobetaine/carnitine-CoA ligase [Gordonibacter sp. An230]